MQRLEVSGAVRPLYGSLGVKGFISKIILRCTVSKTSKLPAIFMFHFSILNRNKSLHFFRCIFLSLKISDLFDSGDRNIVLFESLHKLP